MPKAKNPKPGLTDSWGRRNRKLPDYTCQHCGALFRPKRSTAKYCSRPCMWANNGKGQIPPDGTTTWWVGHKGYIDGKIWRNRKPARIKQHRYVMEQHLGRALRADEDVHHLNGNKADNRLDNLQLMTHSDHSKLHNSERTHRHGYKLNLSPEQRVARSDRAKRQGLSVLGRRAQGLV